MAVRQADLDAFNAAADAAVAEIERGKAAVASAGVIDDVLAVGDLITESAVVEYLIRLGYVLGRKTD